MTLKSFLTTILLLLFLFLVTSIYPKTHSLPRQATFNGLVATPPMGWSSWNHFGCDINEDVIKQTADSLVSSGMKDAGYEFVNIDDCWQGERDAQGNIQADSVRFPNGIKVLADYIHSKGLKIGIYTDVGLLTCEDFPGSLNYEQQDINTYIQWGIDYIKLDWCHNDGLNAEHIYSKWHDLIQQSGHSMVLSISTWGEQSPWRWGPKVGNLWRTTEDIEENWDSIISIIDKNSQYAHTAGPGHWNDPDMLQVGNGDLSFEKNKSHFTMWAIMAAPLVTGNDLRNMSQDILSILTNKEVISVNQDPLGIQGQKVLELDNKVQIWKKPLLNKNTYAIVVFNPTDQSQEFSFTLDQIGLNFKNAQIRDLWQHQELGIFSNTYSSTLSSHGAIAIKISKSNLLNIF